MLVLVAAAICTASTVTAVFAQTLDVVGLDGTSVSVSLETLDRRTVVRGPNDKRPARWISQVDKIEVRQLQ